MFANPPLPTSSFPRRPLDGSEWLFSSCVSNTSCLYVNLVFCTFLSKCTVVLRVRLLSSFSVSRKQLISFWTSPIYVIVCSLGQNTKRDSGRKVQKENVQAGKVRRRSRTYRRTLSFNSLFRLITLLKLWSITILTNSEHHHFTYLLYFSILSGYRWCHSDMSWTASHAQNVDGPDGRNCDDQRWQCYPPWNHSSASCRQIYDWNRQNARWGGTLILKIKALHPSEKIIRIIHARPNTFRPHTHTSPLLLVTSKCRASSIYSHGYICIVITF